MMIYQPGDSVPSKTAVYDNAELPLDALQDAVGGYIEVVPHFDTMLVEGRRERCAVFCNETGKLHDLPRNKHATALWRSAVRHRGLPPIIDELVGPVAICLGDDEWLASL